MRENYSKNKLGYWQAFMKRLCFVLLFCPFIVFGQKKSSTVKTSVPVVILSNDAKLKISYRITDCDKGTGMPNKYAVFSYENKAGGDLKIELKYEIYFKGVKVERDPAMLRANISLQKLQKITGNCSSAAEGMALFLSDTGEEGFEIKIIELNIS